MSIPKIVVSGVVAFVVLVITCMYALPQYKVWQQGLSGQAALKRAEQTRKIKIEAAKAEQESAEHIAKAIATVGKAAKEFPEYRQQQFILAFAEALESGTIDQIIYVPTEGNIPILEAGQR